jgi:hypothetical protein
VTISGSSRRGSRERADFGVNDLSPELVPISNVDFSSTAPGSEELKPLSLQRRCLKSFKT